MPAPDRLESALKSACDFRSFAVGLLHDALGWPIQPDAVRPDDAGYPYSPDELDTAATQHTAKAYELLMLPHEQQPWGIFLLEFDEPKVFETRGFGTPLRAVLRRLVASRRKDPSLRSWACDNILFVCTHDYQQYVFAMFRDTFGTGKVGDAKLAQFGWNADQPCRTVVTENLPCLKWPDEPEDKAAWVRSWAEAFNKEPLTKRFFKQFDTALELIKTDLEKLGKLKSSEAYSRAQLLLERLIFLYFVQNRGWLNQRRGFLLEGFAPHRNRPKECSYYSDFLETLFWSLSSAGHTSFDRWEYVPFLNGGLFNDDEFEPSPRRKKDNPALPIRNSTFAKVFDDFLEAFNFTVREDTPLNQEVAVDPEMLGKVFESIVLHAESADPDATAPDRRKETGSFYTPRIVVHFICREVLYQWFLPRLSPSPAQAGEGGGEGSWPSRLRTILDLDASDGLDREELETLKSCLSPGEGTRLLELVKALRCCDPAVGSGAFMVGLLHELTNLRRLAQTAANGYVDPTRKPGSNWLHETKADIIENCLFGVDIQQQAVEICMLRLWLSLVVDYDLGLDPFEADRKAFLGALKDISQLPNLEMNFRRGDSLHDHICGVPVVIKPYGQYGDLYAEIGRLGRILHNCSKATKKHEYRLKILRKRIELARRVIADTLKHLRQELDSDIVGMFGVAGSKAERKRHIDHETALLSDALDRLVTLKEEMGKLEALPKDPLLLVKLRKLEGASFDAPFNFAWRIDFPQVFYPGESPLPLGEGKGEGAGFDILVGNPPFVTARNKDKRELYRERWQPYCHMKYHLLVPFFPLSFGLLRPGGQLGFIVSNAFAKREFGKPLVERFFPKVNLQKVVDCSGLMFPGHGTPTCLIFGANQKPDPKAPIRVAALLPGGGDLHTPPEESALWHTLEKKHDRQSYDDGAVQVAAVEVKRLLVWPMNFMAGAEQTRAAIAGPELLGSFIVDHMGFDVIFGARELYDNPASFWRRAGVGGGDLILFSEGDMVRNYAQDSDHWCLFPYDSKLKPSLSRTVASLLAPWRKLLSERPQLGGQSQVDFGLAWYEYYRFTRRGQVPTLVVPEIATHVHVAVSQRARVYTQTAPIIPASCSDGHGLQLHAALLNSSAALFWLKQVCFSKRESEQPEKDTYYVFAGGKVEQLPVPEKVAQALKGEWNPLAKRLAAMAEECWTRGQKLPTLAMKKLFEKSGEAYHEWNSSLPGYEQPHSVIGKPFGSAEELKQAYDRVVAERERLRSEMIALQEEMDWLVYAAYGLLPEDHPTVGFVPSPFTGEGKGEGTPEPLDKHQRPYRLWQAAKGDFAAAIGLIPTDWSASRRARWRERLTAIRDNEHIRRIEQPVYKRRWDEQWKVKNRWECGPVAYEQELADAFDWWLLEKAEWSLEHKSPSHTVFLSEWAELLWRDKRVQAAVGAVYPMSAGVAGFERLLKQIVDEESVPDGIPFAKPWDELERKKLDGLAKARKIRGKLNVPRERFHVVSRGVYRWAGLLFR